MLRCICRTVVLNREELEAHIIKKVVIDRDSRDNHDEDKEYFD